MANIAGQIQEYAKNWMNQVAQGPADSVIERSKYKLAVKLLTRFVGQAIPFTTRNGFEIVDFGPGYVKATIPLKPNKNHFNAMYAGALYTVAEIPGGVLSLLNFDKAFYPILAEMTMRYLKPATSDVTVEFKLSKAELKRIQGEAKEQGRSNFTLEGEIKDAEGQIVATSTAYYQVRMK